MENVPGIVTSWTAGKVLLLVWSTKAFLYTCNGATNPLLLKKSVESAFRASDNEFDIVCFAANGASACGGPVTKRIFNNGTPTLVYNMAKCPIHPPATFLLRLLSCYAEQGLKQPCIISLNKPTNVPIVPGISYASYDQRETTCNLLYPLLSGKDEAIKVLLSETRMLGLPPTFDPAYDLLFDDSNSNNAKEDDSDGMLMVMNEEPFCSYANCHARACIEFSCTYCFNTFCTTECRELVCGLCCGK